MTRANYLRDAREDLLRGIGVPTHEKFVADDFQKQAINSVAEGVDTLVVAPTGSGKTYIAMESISIALSMKCRAVYTTPLKALSNTKYTELSKRFEPDYKVGILTGDRKIDTDADVVVATTEIYRNELYRHDGRYSVVVLDEVHYIADLQRGPVWEESIILTPRDSTLLMLSASISNAREIADWLEDVRGKECRIVMKQDRPVELRLGFLHPELGVLPLRNERNEVFKEVSHFYGQFGLDAGGMRLKQKRGPGGSSRGQQGRGDHEGRGRGSDGGARGSNRSGGRNSGGHGGRGRGGR
jgi:ATP-dependent RNA helicase HelY